MIQQKIGQPIFNHISSTTVVLIVADDRLQERSIASFEPIVVPADALSTISLSISPVKTQPAGNWFECVTLHRHNRLLRHLFVNIYKPFQHGFPQISWSIVKFSQPLKSLDFVVAKVENRSNGISPH